MSEIFFGSGLEKSEKHATCPPVGEKFNIKTITLPMIAYTATQVCVVFTLFFNSLTAIFSSRLASLLAPQLHGVLTTVYFYLVISTMLYLSFLSILVIHG